MFSYCQPSLTNILADKKITKIYSNIESYSEFGNNR